jgi:hypothetical protein
MVRASTGNRQRKGVVMHDNRDAPSIVPILATFSPAVHLTHQDGAYRLVKFRKPVQL